MFFCFKQRPNFLFWVECWQFARFYVFKYVLASTLGQIPVTILDFSVIYKVRVKLVPRNHLLAVRRFLAFDSVLQLVHFVFFDFNEYLVECQNLGLFLCCLDCFLINKIYDLFVSAQGHDEPGPLQDGVIVGIKTGKNLFDDFDLGWHQQQL